MPSRLQQTIAEYRQRLLDHERTAMAVLDFAHRQAVAVIDAQLDTLFLAMTNYMQAGEPIPLEWLYENRRLQVLEQYITQTIDHYGALTQMQVARLQHMGVQLGMQSGMALLQSTVPMGVTFAFGIPDQQAITNLIGATQAGSPLADLFNGFGKEAAQAAKDALISGVTLGYGPRQIAPGIQDALNISRYRALTIARTESLRSYRGANLETFKANSDVVDQWRWTCALSMRTCAACIAMDGTLHDLSESMDSHPCCRCTMTPVTKSWDDILSNIGIDTTGIEDTNPALDMQTGQDWFNNLDADQQRQILGPSKYDAYADGKFQLSDVVGTSHDADWGNSIYERSLKDTLEAANSAPAAVEEVPKLSALEQRVQDIQDEMNAKYPNTVFDLAGAHPDIIEPAMKQLDELMQQYPGAAKTIPYIGTGENIPEALKRAGYEGFDKDNLNSFAYCSKDSTNSGQYASTPMFLNPKFFGDPELMQEAKRLAWESGWSAGGGGDDWTISTVTHEFGHVLNFFLDIEGRNQSFMDFINYTGHQGEIAATLDIFIRENSKLGNKISTYAQTNDYEKFAEAFLQMDTQPKSTWATYTRRLYNLLQQLIPDGSTDGWTTPSPSKWTEDQFNAWEAFYDKYIKGR